MKFKVKLITIEEFEFSVDENDPDQISAYRSEDGHYDPDVDNETPLTADEIINCEKESLEQGILGAEDYREKFSDIIIDRKAEIKKL